MKRTQFLWLVDHSSAPRPLLLRLVGKYDDDDDDDDVLVLPKACGIHVHLQEELYGVDGDEQLVGDLEEAAVLELQGVVWSPGC